LWDDIQFPLDPSLKETEGLPVTQSSAAQCQKIEETYTIDASATVTITITNVTAIYKRTYRLGRWAAKDAPVTPSKQRLRHPTRKQAEGRR
jgi:hypothetical protein